MESQPSTELHLPEAVTKKPVKQRGPKKTKPVKEQKEMVKRSKHPEKWKVNVKKNARLRGEEYIGVGGKKLID